MKAEFTIAERKILRRCDAAVSLRAADLCLAFTCSGFGLCMFKAAFLCICVCCRASEGKIISARSWAEMQLQRSAFPSLQAAHLARLDGLPKARVYGPALIAFARHRASAEKPPGFEPQLSWRPPGLARRNLARRLLPFSCCPFALLLPKKAKGRCGRGGPKWPRDLPLANLPQHRGC